MHARVAGPRRPQRQPDTWIEERRVDAVGVHIGDAGVRVEASLAAFIVCHRIVAHDTVTGADRAECAKSPAAAKFFAIDAQTLFAVFVNKQARRPITERPIDVVLPQIERLEDVAVGIDDIVRTTHNPPPFG